MHAFGYFGTMKGYKVVFHGAWRPNLFFYTMYPRIRPTHTTISVVPRP